MGGARAAQTPPSQYARATELVAGNLAAPSEHVSHVFRIPGRSSVKEAVFSPDGTQCAIVCDEPGRLQSIRVWSEVGGCSAPIVTAHRISSVHWPVLPNGAAEGTIAFLSWEEGSDTWRISAHWGIVSGVVIHRPLSTAFLRCWVDSDGVDHFALEVHPVDGGFGRSGGRMEHQFILTGTRYGDGFRTREQYQDGEHEKFRVLGVFDGKLCV
jgi:WD40 repeat protein